MTNPSPDVVVIGGGIVGCATAYYLARAGARVTIVERDSVGGHASGFALGGLSPLAGAGIPEPLGELSLASYRIHEHLSTDLKEETGIDTELQFRTAMNVVFSERDAALLRERLPWQQAQNGFDVQWKDRAEVLALEPRINPEVLGGVVTHPVGLLDPYRLNLALLQAAERMGATMRNAQVDGLTFRSQRVTGALVRGQAIACDRVVIAMGPWCDEASEWVGLRLPLSPLKGQIVRLRLAGPPIAPYLSFGHGYAVSKPDGLIWVGTTEETVGFDESPTTEARDSILSSALEALPFLEEAEVVQQTACLRPVTPDNLPILGLVPGKEGIVVAAGAGRKGIHLAPIMGLVAADLALDGRTEHDISALAPDREFVGAESATGSWET